MSTVNIDDITEFEIIEESPRKIKIGNRFILIKQLSLKDYFMVAREVAKMYFKYTDIFINILKIIQDDQKETNKRKSIMNYLVIVIKLEKFRKDVIKLLNKMFPAVGRRFPFCKSYLERHATINDILQIVFGLYTYNFGDVKKNINILIDSMGIRETKVSQTLTSSSKKNLDGKPEQPIKPRFERLRNTEKDTPNSTEKKKVTEISL